VKILDRYILTSFIQTFVSVFVILFFIFILQGIWLFIAELAGKDLDAWLVMKFLLFYSPKIVPLVLPLSVLLASIMTFGNFAENYEFAAMKSSGISLNRAMRSLIIFICGLSIVAFFFANNVIPQAEYKFINLRKNIIQRKPAMAIVEGQFNAVGNFNIKVEKKTGENGEKLKGVTIHKRKPGAATATIIRSKTGTLKSSEKSNLLQLELFDGYYYEEVSSQNPTERDKLPFAKSSFSKQTMNIDLTALNSNDEDEEQVAHTNNMLNVSELNYTLDSLQGNYNKDSKSITANIVQRPNNILSDAQSSRDMMPPLKKGIPHGVNNGIVNTAKDSVKPIKRDKVPGNLLAIIDKTDRVRIIDMAINNINSTDYVVTAGKNELQEKIKSINNHWLALYDKFVIAFACLLMFFIGAPLGAIIRKGGLGLPIVFAVLIFIIFHFINTFGRKMAQENGIPPFLGSWMSTFVLTPLAVLLTYRATNDIGLISMDNILMPLQKAFNKLFKTKPKEA
jgi:lipopolysaccharide export system permease protein